MEPAIAAKYGAVLGLSIFAWQVISAAVLGATPLFIPVATGIEVAVLLLLYNKVAPGTPLGPKIATGSAASAVGAVMAVLGSLVVSQVLFPDLLASLPDTPSAFEAAAGGFMGTLFTGVVLSALLVFLRRNKA
jgi:hypothetical protein